MPTNETLGFSVTWNGSIRANASTDIIDKSYPITYGVGWYADSAGTTAISSLYEGRIAYVIITTVNVPNGTDLTVTLTGANSADVGGEALTKTVTINNNRGYTSWTIAVDNPGEGNVEWTATVKNGSTTVGSSKLTVNDITFSALWSSDAIGSSGLSSINEGSTAYLVVKSPNIPNGNQVTVTLTDIQAADIDGGELTRTLTFTNGIASTSWKFINDIISEGDEIVTATVKLNTTTVATAGLVIKDTSVTPETTYNLRFVNSSSGTTDVSSVNEGGAIYLLVTTTNFPDGTLYVNLSGNGISTDDVEGGNLIKPIAISGNSGRISWNILNDISTEGPETLTAKLTATNSMSGTVLAQDSLTINDTSVNAAYSGAATFKAGNYKSSPGVYNRGFIYYPSISITAGEEINDTIKINNQLVDLTYCYILDVPTSPLVSLFVDVGNRNIITIDMNLVVKLTNLTNNKTYTSPILEIVTVDGSWEHGWYTGVNDPALASLLREMMADNNNVKVEFTYS